MSTEFGIYLMDSRLHGKDRGRKQVNKKPPYGGLVLYKDNFYLGTEGLIEVFGDGDHFRGADNGWAEIKKGWGLADE